MEDPDLRKTVQIAPAEPHKACSDRIKPVSVDCCNSLFLHYLGMSDTELGKTTSLETVECITV